MKKITSKLLIFLLAIIVISTPTITRIHATISHPTSVGVYSKEILYPYDNSSNTCRYNMTWNEVVNATGYQVYYKCNARGGFWNWVHGVHGDYISTKQKVSKSNKTIKYSFLNDTYDYNKVTFYIRSYYKNGNGTTAYSNWVSVVCYPE